MHPGRVSFVLFLIIFHNGFALHYKYDPRWKWKENQFVDLNDDFRVHHSGKVHISKLVGSGGNSPTSLSTHLLVQIIEARDIYNSIAIVLK
ncbi:hypothetical protein M8J76_017192 [Diaphorina citri]|nr:hypothetical protein M8J76_017192 [Diaphorina citri]